MNRKELVKLFKDSFKGWLGHGAPIRAAALTFFIILPLPSLLLIAVTFFAQIYGQGAATQYLIQQISSIAGPVVAQLFKELLASATSPFATVWSAITAVGFSLAGGIGAFAILRDSMNVIWEVELPKTKKLAVRIRQTIGPFLLVSSLGLIVIAGTTISTAVFSAIKLYSINKVLTLISLTAAQIVLSFGLSAVLFAIIYKVLPDREVHWRDVAFPAMMAGVAFTVTNYILGTYIQTFTITTIIGAAGSLIIILIWIYILNQIVLFGAELSKVYATTYGPHPSEHVITATEKIFDPLEKAGEKIEDAVLGPLAESPEKPAEKAETQPAEKPEVQVDKKEETAKTEASPVEKKQKEAEPENLDEGVVEVSVKIKPPRKKRESEE
ncbi:MAG: YihY/virulence factor BrkB family protein [Candidatus Bathyarchaeia archaeon]|jgi:membrane protein